MGQCGEEAEFGPAALWGFCFLNSLLMTLSRIERVATGVGVGKGRVIQRRELLIVISHSRLMLRSHQKQKEFSQRFTRATLPA